MITIVCPRCGETAEVVWHKRSLHERPHVEVVQEPWVPAQQAPPDLTVTEERWGNLHCPACRQTGLKGTWTARDGTRLDKHLNRQGGECVVVIAGVGSDAERLG